MVGGDAGDECVDLRGVGVIADDANAGPAAGVTSAAASSTVPGKSSVRVPARDERP